MAGILERVKEEDNFPKIINHYLSAEKKGVLDKQKTHLKDLLGHYLLTKQYKIIPGEYERDQLLVDIIHHTVCHGVVKGLNVNDIVAMVTVMIEGTLLLGAEDKDTSCEKQILKLLHDLSASFSTQYGLQITTEYIKDTILSHSHLYIYLMTNEQEKDINNSTLPLSIPPSCILPLTDGFIEEKWFRQERVGIVEAQYREITHELQTQREALLQEEKEKTALLYNSLNDSLEKTQENSLEEIQTVINPLVKCHVSEVQTELLQKLKEDESQLKYCIDKITANKGRTSTVP